MLYKGGSDFYMGLFLENNIYIAAINYLIIANLTTYTHLSR